MKIQLVAKMHHILDERLHDINAELNAIKESLYGETKSSAGDKHETGRAMVQIEFHNKEVLKERILNLKKDLQRATQDAPTSSSIVHGSLVKTSGPTFFMGVALGKVETESETVFAISMASPVGKNLQGKRVGDSVTFDKKSVTIHSVE